MVKSLVKDICSHICNALFVLNCVDIFFQLLGPPNLSVTQLWLHFDMDQGLAVCLYNCVAIFHVRSELFESLNNG